MRNQLQLSHDDGVIDDEEFMLLYKMYSSRNPEFPYRSHSAFDLEDLDESECMAEFRFRKGDIVFLSDALEIPDTVKCEQRSICDGIEALCILLRRLSYPCRYGDMIRRFAKPVPVLRMVTNQMIDHVYDLHGHRVTQWNQNIMSPAQLQSYCEAITARGAPLNNCFGFIDGTVRPITRPGEHQRVLYNDHKRFHGIKFQSVALPNGLIGNLYGPVGEHRVFSSFFHVMSRIYIQTATAWVTVNSPFECRSKPQTNDTMCSIFEVLFLTKSNFPYLNTFSRHSYIFKNLVSNVTRAQNIQATNLYFKYHYYHDNDNDHVIIVTYSG